MTKNANIRLTERSLDFLKNSFDTITAGMSLIAEPFENLLKININELKGYFTREEIVALVDSQSSTLLSPELIHSNKYIVFALEDFEQLENGISRHEADPEELIAKIKALPSVQIYYLILDIHIFWRAEDKDLEAYISKLS